ncbi:MAG: anti-sigma factor family protein [Acidobacteriota bacterium]
MCCDEAERLMSAYLDNELDSTLQGALASHMAGCARCGDRLESYKRLDGLVAGLPRLGPEPGFTARLAEEVRRAAPEERSVFRTLLQLVESLAGSLRDKPSTRTLDEFGDFPPLSLGSAYFRLIDEAEPPEKRL